MKYISEKDVLAIGIPWPDLLHVIETATALLDKQQVSQPIKPYLRFNDPSNRIIAMPAYVGGEFEVAGIKWIASFPGNLSKGLRRANSIIILNDAATGIPISVINTPVISGIRTASVSGFFLNRYFSTRQEGKLNFGVIGYGPIGQLHVQMLQRCFAERIGKIYIFDINSKLVTNAGENCVTCTDWLEVYEKSDVLITCTVSTARYIDRKPKKDHVYLNISLRDFNPAFLKDVDINVVDDWDEVCRQNTDVEQAHLQFGLQKNDVVQIPSLLHKHVLDSFKNKSVMFNPMGMAVYDMAVAKFYYDAALRQGKYVDLA